MNGDEAVEGRYRRSRWFLVIAAAIAAVLLVRLVAGVTARPAPGESAPPAVTSRAEPSPTPVTLRGRLVYVGDERGGAGQRLYFLDVRTGILREGPALSEVEAMVPAGPRGDWLVLSVVDGAEEVAWLLLNRLLDPIEVARGDHVSVSSNRQALLIGRVETDHPPGCPDPSFELERVVLVDSRHRPAHPIPLPCGRLLSAVMYSSRVTVVSVSEGGGLLRSHVLVPGTSMRVLPGRVLVSSGGFLFLELGGELLVWAGNGTSRAVVAGSITRGRIVATSRSGRYVAVDGVIDGLQGLWVVDAAAGTARPVDATSAGRLLAAAFDDQDVLYVVGASGILAFDGSTPLPVLPPPDAPPPTGPAAWLP
ncbi:MAG TPA: hypothetical protein VF129_11315 [Actinomycetota bacterium]